MAFGTDWALAALLGAIEGITEFLPVSSTGHLILLVDLLGFGGPPGRVFEIAIQLGAIVAVCWAYRARLLAAAAGLPRDPAARRFAAAVALAFLPAAAVGALAHGIIKGILFSPWVVSVALIAGGVAILMVERARPQPRVQEAEAIELRTALGIGAFQVLAMVPGVSRSGATIIGALLLRVDRPAAAEFSFFLGIPTVLGATAFDLYRNRAALDTEGVALIAVGFAAAFAACESRARSSAAFDICASKSAIDPAMSRSPALSSTKRSISSASSSSLATSLSRLPVVVALRAMPLTLYSYRGPSFSTPRAHALSGLLRAISYRNGTPVQMKPRFGLMCKTLNIGLTAGNRRRFRARHIAAPSGPRTGRR